MTTSRRPSGRFGSSRQGAAVLLLSASLTVSCASGQVARPSIRGSETTRPSPCRQPADDLTGPSILVVQGDASGGGYRAATEFLTGCSLECFEGNGQFPCKSRPHLHPPAEWPARHGHREFHTVDDYSRYFVDSGVVGDGVAPPANDLDEVEGLESAHLVFYAGHGTTSSWEAHADKTVQLSDISLGDGDARYLWMLSCHVMAHGPRIPEMLGDTRIEDYLAPHLFDPLRAGVADDCDSMSHADVFCRWGRQNGHGKSPLGAGLRLACGGSTDLGGHDFPSALIWQYKLVAGLDVADSYLLGLAVGARVPLCLTRGDADPASTPLFDRDFLTDPRSGDGGYLYIEYPVKHSVPLESLRSSLPWLLPSKTSQDPLPDEPPELYPVLRVGPMPIPSGFDLLESPEGRPFLFGAQSIEVPEDQAAQFRGALGGFGHRGIALRTERLPSSGAILVHATSSEVVGVDLPTPFDYGDASSALGELMLDSLGLLGETAVPEQPETSAPEITPNANGPHAATPRILVSPTADLRVMVVDRAPETESTAFGVVAKSYPIKRYVKCLYMRAAGVVQSADGKFVVPQLGEGADVVLLQVCPRRLPAALRTLPGVRDAEAAGSGDARLIYLQRAVVGSEPRPVRRRAAAEREAWERLEKRGRRDYERSPGASRWGYRSAPLHCGQLAMYLVYEFDFVPKEGAQYENLPVRTVEVPAHRGIEELHEDWECDPRTEE